MSHETDSMTALDAALAAIDAQIAAARQAADAAARAEGDLRALRATATSPGREVSVTAGATGAIDRIEVQDAALDVDARSLSRLLTETAAQAQGLAAARAVERLAAVADVDSLTVTRTGPVHGDGPDSGA
jgi:DNA-binding protein YbaB